MHELASPKRQLPLNMVTSRAWLLGGTALILAGVCWLGVALPSLGVARAPLFALALLPAYRSGSVPGVALAGVAAIALFLLTAAPTPGAVVPGAASLPDIAVCVVALAGLTGLGALHCLNLRFRRGLLETLEGAGLGAARFDAGGTLLTANEAFSRLLGVPTVVGRSRLQDFPALAAAPWAAEQAEPSGEARVLETGPEQGTRPLRVSLLRERRLLRRPDIVAVVEPLPTVQQESAETLLDSISEVIVSVDLDWRVRFLNARANEVLAPLGGLSPGQSIWELVPETDRARLQAPFERAWREERPVEFEGRYSPLGLDLHIRVFPRRDGLTIVMRDVTAHRESERRLQAAELQLAEQAGLLGTVVEEFGDGLIVTDLEGRPILMNPSARRRVGADFGEVPASSWIEHYAMRHPGGAPLDEAEVPLLRALRGEVVREMPVLLRDFSRGGADLEMEISAAPIRAEDGTLRGAVLWAQDVTRLREAERRQREAESALRRAQRLEAIGQLTGGLAHDFNNLLTVVLGNARLLERSDGLAPPDRELATMIVQAGQRGAELNKRLLAFARRQSLEPEAVDLGALLDGMRRMLERTLGEHIRIRVDARTEGRCAQVDRAELENAVLNLAINARDAMPAGGRLELSTREARPGEAPNGADPARFLALVVTDEGVGMPADVAERAFEPFFTTKAPGKGTGLGLSQVYGFVRQSGGDVQIASAPDAGTEIRLILPLATETDDRRREEAGAAAVSDAGASGARVLVVEDDAQVRLLAEAALLRRGYRVAAVETGEQAVELLASGVFDLVVADTVLPGLQGPELVRRAQALRPGIAALLLSGYANPGAGESLPARLLRKPFDADALGDAVAAALGARAG